MVAIKAITANRDITAIMAIKVVKSVQVTGAIMTFTSDGIKNVYLVAIKAIMAITRPLQSFWPVHHYGHYIQYYHQSHFIHLGHYSHDTNFNQNLT